MAILSSIGRVYNVSVQKKGLCECQKYRITLRNNRISREFNMAAITARSAKKSVSYHDLYNLSIADLLFDDKKKKRGPASKSLGFFEAER